MNNKKKKVTAFLYTESYGTNTFDTLEGEYTIPEVKRWASGRGGNYKLRICFDLPESIAGFYSLCFKFSQKCKRAIPTC